MLGGLQAKIVNEGNVALRAGEFEIVSGTGGGKTVIASGFTKSSGTTTHAGRSLEFGRVNTIQATSKFAIIISQITSSEYNNMRPKRMPIGLSGHQTAVNFGIITLRITPKTNIPPEKLFCNSSQTITSSSVSNGCGKSQLNALANLVSFR